MPYVDQTPEQQPLFFESVEFMTVTAFQQANQLLREGKLEAAVVVYRQAIEQNPNSYLSYQNLGEILGKLGRLGEAVEVYQRAVELKPEVAWSLLGLSQVLQQVGQLDEAQQAWEKAVKIEPKLAIFQKNLDQLANGNSSKPKVSQPQRIEFEQAGQAVERLNKHDINSSIKDKNLLNTEDKVSYYRKLAEINHDSIEILLLLGDALEEKRLYDQALVTYHQVIQKQPDSIQFQDKFVSALSKTEPRFCSEQHYILLGQIQQKRSKWDQALVAYQRAIEINPNFYMSYHHLGDVMFAITNYHEAVVQYRKAIDLNPASPYTYVNLGNTLVQLGYYEEAIVNYLKGIELAPDSFWAYYNLGDALACLGKIDKASLYYCQGVKLDPNPY